MNDRFKNKCNAVVFGVVFIFLLWSGESQAVCQGTSIIATTPTVGFIGNSNGTVIHKKTGLMWKQCSEGLSGINCSVGVATIYSWQTALQAAKTLNTTGGGFAGFTDWRIPNRKELTSIIERQCASPAINSTIFPVTAGQYWTSSPYLWNASQAWFVDFDFGFANGTNKTIIGSHVRLVRGGQ